MSLMALIALCHPEHLCTENAKCLGVHIIVHTEHVAACGSACVPRMHMIERGVAVAMAMAITLSLL